MKNWILLGIVVLVGLLFYCHKTAKISLEETTALRQNFSEGRRAFREKQLEFLGTQLKQREAELQEMTQKQKKLTAQLEEEKNQLEKIKGNQAGQKEILREIESLKQQIARIDQDVEEKSRKEDRLLSTYEQRGAYYYHSTRCYCGCHGRIRISWTEYKAMRDKILRQQREAKLEKKKLTEELKEKEKKVSSASTKSYVAKDTKSLEKSIHELECSLPKLNTTAAKLQAEFSALHEEYKNLSDKIELKKNPDVEDKLSLIETHIFFFAIGNQREISERVADLAAQPHVDSKEKFLMELAMNAPKIRSRIDSTHFKDIFEEKSSLLGLRMSELEDDFIIEYDSEQDVIQAYNSIINQYSKEKPLIRKIF